MGKEKICGICLEPWELVGREYHRENGKKDFFCSNCKNKRKPCTRNSNEDLDSLHEIETKDIPKEIKKPRRHLVIPDCQVTPDSPTEHLEWINLYIHEKLPDVVIHLGDFNDMESLCYYDRGTIYSEGKRYHSDIEAGKEAMQKLTKGINKNGYHPEMHLTTGNHEYRIQRYIEEDPKLYKFMKMSDLGYEDFGWTVHPFLEIAEIDGVNYSHYFCNQLSGKPIGGESILLRLKNIGFSFVMGHQQIYLVGVRSLNNGRRIRGVVIGAAYLHDERFRGPQSNNEWRGILVLNEVKNGDYSLMEVSLDYLCRRYENKPLWVFMKEKYPETFKKSAWLQHQMKNY